MTLLKLLVALALVAACTAVNATWDDSYSTDLILGKRKPYDELVHHEIVTKDASWTRITTDLEWVLNLPDDLVITQVNVINRVRDGTGAGVTITSGGCGYHRVKLTFLSQAFRGIYFDIDIFAKRYRA